MACILTSFHRLFHEGRYGMEEAIQETKKSNMQGGRAWAVVFVVFMAGFCMACQHGRDHVGRATCHAGLWFWPRRARLGQRRVLHPRRGHCVSGCIVCAQTWHPLVSDHCSCMRHYWQYNRHSCRRRCRAYGVAHYPGCGLWPHGRHWRYGHYAVVPQGASRLAAGHLGCVGLRRQTPSRQSSTVP